MTVSLGKVVNDDPPIDDNNLSNNSDEAVSSNNVGESSSPSGDVDFPVAELKRLEDMTSRTKWLIPVLPGGELEVLMNATIDLCRRGMDGQCAPCQRFIRDGMTTSFIKVLTDDAVNGWKPEIHKCIFKNCERLIRLCVLKLHDDSYCLLDLLAIAFNPQNKFHTFNSIKPSEATAIASSSGDIEVFAEPADVRVPKLWLVDLINLFGRLGGFRILLDRFRSEQSLSVMTIFALIRPIGHCHDFLRVPVIREFVLPIIDMVPAFLEKLTDEEMKKEAKNESKNDALSTIVKLLKSLVSRVPGEEETAKSLEMFRLKMILRLLQISSFNGKMNALNELNKVLSNLAFYSYSRTPIASPVAQGGVSDEEVFSAGRMAQWIKDNRVLQIVLCDSMHQPQYVEKLEKIIRFIIKEKALTQDDLDCLWAAQCGKHEAIVKNVHDLLAKLAWDFSPEQLDHLFVRFRESWVSASRKQRERLLELIRRLAEEDKDGVMAHKVLQLLWTLAHSDELPDEIMDQALSAHTKILDCSCSQDRDLQKAKWLDQCVQQLHTDKWVVPTLKQIRDICCLYEEAPTSYDQLGHLRHSAHHAIIYRHDVINRLQNQHSIVTLVSDSLAAYMRHVAERLASGHTIEPLAYCADGRHNHVEQLEQRLLFLRFLLREGRLWLCAAQACGIWHCLAVNAVFAVDRDVCFKWFCSLMDNQESDLDPDVYQDFFRKNVLQLDPPLLTQSGMECFEVFFKAVNLKEGKLIVKRHQYLMEHDDLIGFDYVWRVVMTGAADIAGKAIDLLKETYTSLGARLRSRQADIHREMIASCMDRLRACYDNVSVLQRGGGGGDTISDSLSADDSSLCHRQTTVMFRVLRVLYEYIVQCEREFGEERALAPLFRAYRGRSVMVLVCLVYPAGRASSAGAAVTELRIESHTQQTTASLRRVVLQRINVPSHALRVELYLNGSDSSSSGGGAGRGSAVESSAIGSGGGSATSSAASAAAAAADCHLEPIDQRLCVGELTGGFHDQLLLTAKLTPISVVASQTAAVAATSATSMAVNTSSSPDSSSSSSAPSPQQQQLMAAAVTGTRNGGDCGATGGGGVSAAAAAAAASGEACLPGVLWSQHEPYVHFLLQLCELGCRRADAPLRNAGRSLLDNVPAASHVVDMILALCRHRATAATGGEGGTTQREPPTPPISPTPAAAAAAPTSFRALLFDVPPSNVLYHVQVLYSVLMPGTGDPLTEWRRHVQCRFVAGGGGAAVLEALTSARLVADADASTRRLVYLYVLRLVKLVWASVCCATAAAADSGVEGGGAAGGTGGGVCLPAAERVLLQVAQAVGAQSRSNNATTTQSSGGGGTGGGGGTEGGASMAPLAVTSQHVEALVRLVWWACCVQLDSPHQPPIGEFSQHLAAATHADVVLCREAFETLTLVLCWRYDLLQQLIVRPFFTSFVTDLVLVCGSQRLRQLTCDQLLTIATAPHHQHRHHTSSSGGGGGGVEAPSRGATRLQLISLLLGSLETHVAQRGASSRQLFRLLCSLLESACREHVPLPALDALVHTQIGRLTRLKETALASAAAAAVSVRLGDGDTPRSSNISGSSCGDDQLLEGHLKLLAELVAFLTPTARHQLGSGQLVGELMSAFLFTHSALHLQVERLGRLPDERLPVPVCGSSETRGAALHLLLALSTGCVENLRTVVSTLIEMYYGDCEDTVLDWEYTPPTEARPTGGFVGLKNAGATCYMNSVLQQLFMIDEVRCGVLGTAGVFLESDEEFSEEQADGDAAAAATTDYNIVILKWLQVIFGHLSCSQLQYYVPAGLWTHFRLQGEPLNLREQHDAVEFFVSLVDAVDEAQKALGQPLAMSGQLGGTFSDQKICRQCPHRYAKEEAFTVLNVDIHNFTSLTESLDQYVKGDLLEGANAYHCDKCDCKVDTVKRTCIKKLPPTLCIQLKRFDYDWERDCAIKFNEYFEFPRELNMEPYTVRGLARIDGETVDADWDDDTVCGGVGGGSGGDEDDAMATRYELSGIVVHSGQASGGHYYSFILHRGAGGGGDGGDGQAAGRWYKFDDYDVTECRMHDDDEMRAQCFGGELAGDGGEQTVKRMSSRRQKRWWNAYMLFYTRLDRLSQHRRREPAPVVAPQEPRSRLQQQKRQAPPAAGVGEYQTRLGVTTSHMSRLTLADSDGGVHMPGPVRRAILRQNIRFLHTKNQFYPEFIQFIRQLAARNAPPLPPPASQPSCAETVPVDGTTASSCDRQQQQLEAAVVDETALLCVSLACRFLFIVGFHLKKSVRGAAAEWLDAVAPHLSRSPRARLWLVETIVFGQPGCQRLTEYLLECPSLEVRQAIARMLALVAHCSSSGGGGGASGDSGGGEHLRVPVRLPMLLHEPGWQQVTLVHEAVVRGMLALLRKHVSEHGRHVGEYFAFFAEYAGYGEQERRHLLDLNVPVLFISLALDESPMPTIKYQYAELGSLYRTVALLVRSCDVQSHCAPCPSTPPASGGATTAATAVQHAAPLPNPYGEPPRALRPLPPQLAHLMFGSAPYIKKLLEDNRSVSDTVALLCYCCWENAPLSAAVLAELLYQISYSYNYECRPYLELLQPLLLMADSWQCARLLCALLGGSCFGELHSPDTSASSTGSSTGGAGGAFSTASVSTTVGLCDTVHRFKIHHQRRAYHCLKFIVDLLATSCAARRLLSTHAQLGRQYCDLVHWLRTELERRPFQPLTTPSSSSAAAASQLIQPTAAAAGGVCGSGMGAGAWCHSNAVTNDSVNVYYLERSNSALGCLDRALELCPQQQQQSGNAEKDNNNSSPVMLRRTPDTAVVSVSTESTTTSSTTTDTATASPNTAHISTSYKNPSDLNTSTPPAAAATTTTTAATHTLSQGPMTSASTATTSSSTATATTTSSGSSGGDWTCHPTN